jgi:hypothetical protein
MEQQQQIESDEKFMRENGWQCKPYSEEEQDGDSELVKTIKRLRKNKINCQPYNYLDIELQAMMRQGEMSLNDALRLMQANQEQQQIEPLHSPPAPSPPRPPVAAGSEVDIVDIEAAEEAARQAAEDAARQAAEDAEYFRNLQAGVYKNVSRSIPIPPRKRGGKKRSTKKRTNTKKRSYKKQTNTKKRSYKKRN